MDETVTLVIEDKTIECSRTLLIEKSDYFKAMLAGGFVERTQNRINIGDIHYTPFELVLKLLEENDLPVQDELLLPVLTTAHVLQFLQVQTICTERLSATLGIQNCLRFWFFSENLGIRELTKKAQLVALLQFEGVCQTPDFLDVTYENLLRYLRHPDLFLTSQLYLLHAGYVWWEKSGSADKGRLETLISLVDFTEICQNEFLDVIKEIPEANRPMVRELCEKYQSQQSGNRKLFFPCNVRNTQGYPCFLLERPIDFSPAKLLDKHKRKRKCDEVSKASGSKSVPSASSLSFTVEMAESGRRLFDVNDRNLSTLQGYKLRSYKNKVYLFGGEFVLGSGIWNKEVYAYDVITKEWSRCSDFPYMRRHFQAHVSEDRLFVVGGTGKFRVIQDNLLYYDIRTDSWSSLYFLPQNAVQLLCCAYKNTVLFLYLNGKSGFMLSYDYSFHDLTIPPNTPMPSYNPNIFLFSVNHRLYLLEKKLYLYDVVGMELRYNSYRELPDIYKNCDNYNVESLLCRNTVYTLLVDNFSNVVQLCALNLEDFTVQVQDKSDFLQSPTRMLFTVYHENCISI